MVTVCQIGARNSARVTALTVALLVVGACGSKPQATSGQPAVVGDATSSPEASTSQPTTVATTSSSLPVLVVQIGEASVQAGAWLDGYQREPADRNSTTSPFGGSVVSFVYTRTGKKDSDRIHITIIEGAADAKAAEAMGGPDSVAPKVATELRKNGSVVYEAADPIFPEVSVWFSWLVSDTRFVTVGLPANLSEAEALHFVDALEVK